MDERISTGGRDEGPLFVLPGRDWRLLLGPQLGSAERMTMSLAIFPPGSAPPGHVHAIEEEVVFVLAGTGRLLTEHQSIPLSPGVAFRVPPGLVHGAVNDGNEPLELLCMFSPPVTPGGYEAGAEIRPPPSQSDRR